MNRFRKLILLGIVALCVLPARATPLFDAMYWLEGKITINADPNHVANLLGNRRVVFYKSLPGAFIDQSFFQLPNNYMINIYDNGQLSIDPSATYSVAVAQDPTDHYGANPQPVTIHGNGFETQDLTLKHGEGPIIPLAGALQLTIARSGSDIKLSWDMSEKSPNIYYMVGKGNGEFTNDVIPEVKGGFNWLHIPNLNTDDPNLDGFNSTNFIINGGILHKNQVGKGEAEVYYKALDSSLANNNNLTDPTTQKILSSAWAVGKYNVTISRNGANGWNLMGFPFDIGDIKDSFFGAFDNADEIKMYDNNKKVFTDKTVKYSGGAWSSAAYSRGVSYWIYRALPTPVQATMIGNVQFADAVVDISRNGANGWNWVGLPFLSQMTLSNFGPSNADALDEIKSRDDIGKKIEQSYPKNIWGQQSILPAKGYYFYRAIPAPLSWQMKFQ